MNNYNCIIILGPTASGKTNVAVKIAYENNGEILSIDSRQVYKNLNLGTGKDLHSYYYKKKRIKHHLIDIISPIEKYHLYQFANDFYSIFKSLSENKITPILCGGTALYYDCLLKKQRFVGIPVNNELRNHLEQHSINELKSILLQYPTSQTKNIDTSTKKRIIRGIEIVSYLQTNQPNELKYHDLKPYVIGIDNGIERRKFDIKKRLQQRLDEGLIDEAIALIQMGVKHEQLMYFGLEYKFLSMYLRNEINYSQLYELLSTAIIQFAKRQMTFFRKLEKEGLPIHWMDYEKAIQHKLELQ